jgi:hypothetical protein
VRHFSNKYKKMTKFLVAEKDNISGIEEKKKKKPKRQNAL